MVESFTLANSKRYQIPDYKPSTRKRNAVPSYGDRRNYIDVTYYVGPKAFKAPILNENSAKYDVKNGFEFTDVTTAELEVTNPPIGISALNIITTPQRKCPSGQKMDFFGTCKEVWRIGRRAGNLQVSKRG